LWRRQAHWPALVCVERVTGLIFVANCATAAIAGDAKGYVFRTTRSKTGILTGNPMTQSDVYRMIRRRTFAAGIKMPVGNHSFRATGITQYLKKWRPP
jgi:integrase